MDSSSVINRSKRSTSVANDHVHSLSDALYLVHRINVGLKLTVSRINGVDRFSLHQAGTARSADLAC